MSVKPGSLPPNYQPLNNGAPRAEWASFARLFAVWCASVICGGITPGQTVFTPLFADAGLFANVCAKTHGSDSEVVRCDQQDILIASVFNGLQLVSLMGLLPAGIFFDSLGGRRVSILGTFTLAGGLLFLVALLAFAGRLTTSAQSTLFILAVILVAPPGAPFAL